MSKRSKACEISQKVKEIVWNRDNHKCIYCKRYVPKTCANAHYKKRSQRRIGHRREYSYIMPRMPLSRRPWTKHTII
nr:MAG TPA: IcmS, IcmW, IcmO (DotL) IV secretion system, Coupling.8A [Caudoviricetes sp.]